MKTKQIGSIVRNLKTLQVFSEFTKVHTLTTSDAEAYNLYNLVKAIYNSIVIGGGVEWLSAGAGRGYLQKRLEEHQSFIQEFNNLGIAIELSQPFHRHHEAGDGKSGMEDWCIYLSVTIKP